MSDSTRASTQVQVLLDHEDHELLTKLCRSQKTSKSEILRRALRSYQRTVASPSEQDTTLRIAG